MLRLRLCLLRREATQETRSTLVVFIFVYIKPNFAILFEMEKDYKGTIIKESLVDESILSTLEVVREYTEEDQDDTEDKWHFYTVLVSKNDISTIQPYLKREGGWYIHFWKGNNVIVIFRDKTFEIDSIDKSTWKDAIDYGLSVGVPIEQLDFLISED